jgi:hypothetical protein
MNAIEGGLCSLCGFPIASGEHGPHPENAHAIEAIQGLERHAMETLERSAAVAEHGTEEEKRRLVTPLERLKRVALSATRIVGAVSAIVLAAERTQRAATDYDVTESQGPDGAIYTHEDAETTHILNVLAGKEALTEADRIAILRTEAESNADGQGIPLPEDWETLDEDGVKRFIVDTLIGEGKPVAPEGRAAALQELSDVFTRSFEPPSDDPDVRRRLYEALWKVERENGNPRIRWDARTAPEGMDADRLSVGWHANRDQYSPMTNTVRLKPFGGMGSKREALVAELSHAKQFTEDDPAARIRLIARGVADYLRTAARVVKKDASVKDAYDELYAEPGSIEHEAHEVIEPRIAEHLESAENDIRSEDGRTP